MTDVYINEPLNLLFQSCSSNISGCHVPFWVIKLGTIVGTFKFIWWTIGLNGSRTAEIGCDTLWAFEHVSQDTPTYFQVSILLPVYTSNQSQLAASAIPKTGYWAEGHSARGELGEALNLGVKMAEENLPWAFLPYAWLNRNPVPRFWSICVKGNVAVKRSVKDEGSQAFMMLQRPHESQTCNKGKADQHALGHLQH